MEFRRPDACTIVAQDKTMKDRSVSVANEIVVFGARLVRLPAVSLECRPPRRQARLINLERRAKFGAFGVATA